VGSNFTDVSPFNFWQQIKQAVFDQLAPIAQDLLAAPASQAYVESSLCQDYYQVARRIG